MAVTVVGQGTANRGYSSADVVSPTFTPNADALLLASVNVNSTGATCDDVTGHEGSGEDWVQLGGIVGLWSHINLSLWGCFTGSSPGSDDVHVIRTTDSSRMEVAFLEARGIDVSGTVANALKQHVATGGYGASRTINLTSPTDPIVFLGGVGFTKDPTLTGALVELEEFLGVRSVNAGWDEISPIDNPSHSWTGDAPNGARAIELKPAAAAGGRRRDRLMNTLLRMVISSILIPDVRGS